MGSFFGQGLLTVQGAGSTLTSTGTLDIGATGTGTMNVSSGGTVDTIGLEVQADGTFNLSGGLMDATTIDHTAGGAFNFTGGTLSVDTFQGSLTQQGGTLAPGSSPGTTHITGDYNLNAGSLAIEIGGTVAGTEHDAVVVTGALNLGATSVLDVTLINGFTPSAGDSFDLFDFGSLNGAFGTVNLPTLATNLQWFTGNLYVDGSLLVFDSSLPADLSGDGDVDDEDLGLFFSAFTGPDNGPSSNPDADLSGDGDVDDEDFGIAFSAFTGPLAPVNIPEPGTWALFSLAGMLIARRRRRA